MPRKVKYGLDHDDEDYGYNDDYDDYDDNSGVYVYDDDNEYDSRIQEKAKVSNTKQETVGSAVWRCPICTYDNEEGMPSCDICGVFRNPLTKSCSSGSMGTVDGIYKDSGASIVAKSLFALLPRLTKKALTLKPGTDDYLAELSNNFYKPEKNQGLFSDINKALGPRNIKDKLNIDPFKFDVPSPDDLVSAGINSSRLGSKAYVSKSSSLDVLSSVRGNDIALESSAKSSNVLSSSVSNSTNDSLEMNNPLMDGSENGILSSNLNNMSLNVKSENLTNAKVERCISRSQYKPEKWMVDKLEEFQSNQLNLAIVGHVDSGKSTLSGRLLHLLGRISQKQMHKYEKEAKLQGKGSFAFAWALDESAEERERGITMAVAVAYFETKNYHVVLLDSPGHKDFVPNMISGATQADAAILVIDALPGSFEVGLDSIGGQTREHAQLIRSFGVDQVIIAVNKMDGVKYSKDRFDMIQHQLGTFLRSCGFKDSCVSWVPLSAMENQNLVASASDLRLLSWYTGPCLLNAIDSLQPPTRDFYKPLLMPICDVIKSQSQGQVSACGKLEAGALRSGTKVLLMPSGEIGVVRSLERDSKACDIARAGDNVAVTLQAIDASHVLAGGVLCHPDFPVAVANHLELKVLVLDVTTPVLIGSQLEFHVHHVKEAARVVKILALLDPKTGKEIKKSPRCLLSKQSAVLEVVTQEALCVEDFSSSKALGRVFLRSFGRTVAVGVITKIIG